MIWSCTAKLKVTESLCSGKRYVTPMPDPDPAHVEHDERQSAYFDERFQFFLEPIPEWIQKRTFDIVQSIGLTHQSCVLDIGCGVGALIVHFLEVGVKP